MELKQYINILWRRKWVILFTITVTMVAVVLNTRQQTPMFRASTTLRIAASAGGTLNYSEYVYAAQLMNTYVEIATSRPVLDELKTQLSLKQLPVITAEVIPNTELVRINVESANPDTAAKAANSLANILITDSKDLYTGGGKTSQEILGEQLIKAQAELDQTRKEYARLIVLTPAPTGDIENARQLLQLNQNTYTMLLGQFTQVSLRDEIRASMVTVVETAVIPQSPFKPQIPMNYFLGFAIGLMGGLGLAFILENLDTSLYKSEDIETIVELTAIAKIPKANKKILDDYQNDFSPFADAFQNLAVNLQPVKDQAPKKVLLVMSAVPNQGKSTIVHRLALSLAELGKKVVAIDCDVRLPKLHILFDLSNESGLTDVLEQKTNLNDALQTSPFGDVKLLTSGTPSSHPPKLFGSPQMVSLIDGLSREFDYILLDTPALLATADVTNILPNVDSVLLVVRQGYVRREALQAVKKILTGFRFRNKSIDLVVNQTENNSKYNHYQYRKNMASKTVADVNKPT